MRKDEKACSDTAMSEQAGKVLYGEQHAGYNQDCNPDCAGESISRIAEILGHGSENAIPTAEIRVLCSFPSRRATRAEIARERENGVLICSNNRGLFLPSVDREQRRQELQQHLRTSEARASSLLKTLKHFRQELARCEGQTQLSEVVSDAKAESG